MTWTPKNDKSTPFSEEDACMISKEAPCAIWAGTKVMYSGTAQAGNASGYQYKSGEGDVQNISWSGWGEIRVPELNQLHHIFVFPKDQTLIARDSYTSLVVSTASGYPAGHGGCSGKIALIHYAGLCTSGYLADVDSTILPMGCSNQTFASNQYNSGLVDVVAFGSQM